MKILSVHLNNTKSHHDSLFTFSSGINVLCGANGAGKSTVFEAIGYALFGVDAQEFVADNEEPSDCSHHGQRAVQSHGVWAAVAVDESGAVARAGGHPGVQPGAGA